MKTITLVDSNSRRSHRHRHAYRPAAHTTCRLVTENSSLDDFVSADPDSDEAADSDSGSPSTDVASVTDADADADTDTDMEVTPARTIYAWSPAGSSCEACGATVDRRWRDGNALVCADCKPW